MKKLLTGITLGVTTALSMAPLAFGATDTIINPCDSNALSSASAQAFRDNLCNLTQTGTGNVIRNVIIAVLVVATLISLFFLIRGGINWILSGGDKAKVTAARETLVAAIVGLIITFLAYFILNLVLSLFGLSFTNLVIPNITGK
jgi:uncharacterized protein YacL